MSDFLTLEDIEIGSWWAASDGGKYGCVVISKNEKTKDVKILNTNGKEYLIDFWKLQYRYYNVIPNIAKIEEDE